MLSVKITANNLTEEMASLILKKQWRLETESFEGEKLRKFVFSLCTNEVHRDELTETLNSYRKEYGIKELEEDLYIENKPNYLDGFYVKTYQNDEIIINVKYSYFIKKVLERIEEGKDAKEYEDTEEEIQPESDKKKVMMCSYFTTKQKVEFFRSLNRLNDIELTLAQKLIIDSALSDSGISVYAMRKQSGKTLVLSILNSINDKLIEMAREGRIYNGKSLNLGTAKTYKLNYNSEPFRNIKVDFDLFIEAYPDITNFCTGLVLVDRLDLLDHSEEYQEIYDLMQDEQPMSKMKKYITNKMLSKNKNSEIKLNIASDPSTKALNKYRFIITTDIDSVNHASTLGDWLLNGMGDCGEKEYFPSGDTLVNTTKNCKLFIVNETPWVYQNEKQ